MFTQKLYRLKSYLQYLFRAKTKYYIHSPFVYELSEEVIYDKRRYYAFDDIAHVRALLLASDRRIQVTDLGALSTSANSSRQRLVRDIANTAALPSQIGELLFRLTLRYQPKYALELGTSLGIGTLYMAMACRTVQLTTIEGCPETAQLAAQIFEKIRLTNIASKVGNFDDLLAPTLAKIPSLDLVFFDGNHRYEPTIQYFEQCLTKIHPDTVFIFDDIHWSSDMTRAWHYIQQHAKVVVTIDLYRVGLVFFRQGQAKENFSMYFF